MFNTLATFELAATNGKIRHDYSRMLTGELPRVRTEINRAGLSPISIVFYDCQPGLLQESINDFKRRSWFNQPFSVVSLGPSKSWHGRVDATLTPAVVKTSRASGLENLCDELNAVLVKRGLKIGGGWVLKAGGLRLDVEAIALNK
ncbi:MAG: hypothetical protein GY832_26135 [Chloroflexi bacterium]|nr:hypothetical protein [Chloroflexota bacterium]